MVCYYHLQPFVGGETLLGFLRRQDKDKTEQAARPTRAGFFSRISQLLGRPALDAGDWDELEEALILADVGLPTASRLLATVRERARRESLASGEAVAAALRQAMVEVLSLPSQAPAPSPSGLRVVLAVGVNGSGKTTSIAKLAYALKQEGQAVVLAAADTFRAAAIDQLQVWGERAGATVIAGQPGADPGAVAFDALQAARSRRADVLLVDTAGRLHTKFNLMEELKKVHRILERQLESPPEVLLVLDATMGQNALAQARHFLAAVGVHGIFLAKLDGTAKGGIVLAICHELQVPVAFIGTGEGLEDLAPFDPVAFAAALLPPLRS